MKAWKSDKAKQMTVDERTDAVLRKAALRTGKLVEPKDNLTLIRERYQDKFGKLYADNTGQIYKFIGIVIAEDDYYYGLMNLYDKKWTLSSCVGYLEESGYEEVVK